MGRPSLKTPELACAEIYGLYDPTTGALRYIGKANCSKKRLASHKRDARRRRTPVYDWFNSLAKAGLEPVLKVLEVTGAWEEAERRLIADARARGERLLNLADGGDQPQTTPEQLQRCFAGMMAKRPPNVMRVYRNMETAIRHSRKYFPENVERRVATYEEFKRCVESHRNAGTLEDLDSLLGVMFTEKRVAHG